MLLWKYFLAFLLAIAISLSAPFMLHTEMFQHAFCGPVSYVLFSPNRSNKIVVTDYASGLRLCTQNFAVYLGSTISRDDDLDKVFDVGRSYDTRDDAPTISWTSESTILITLNNIAPVLVSKKFSSNVKIKYEIGTKAKSEILYIEEILANKAINPEVYGKAIPRIYLYKVFIKWLKETVLD